MTAKNISLRMTDTRIERVDKLAATLGRSRAWVLNEATERLLDYEEWFVQELLQGLQEVEQGKIAADEQVTMRFKKWGVNAR